MNETIGVRGWLAGVSGVLGFRKRQQAARCHGSNQNQPPSASRGWLPQHNPTLGHLLELCLESGTREAMRARTRRKIYFGHITQDLASVAPGHCCERTRVVWHPCAGCDFILEPTRGLRERGKRERSPRRCHRACAGPSSEERIRQSRYDWLPVIDSSSRRIVGVLTSPVGRKSGRTDATEDNLSFRESLQKGTHSPTGIRNPEAPEMG